METFKLNIHENTFNVVGKLVNAKVIHRCEGCGSQIRPYENYVRHNSRIRICMDCVNFSYYNNVLITEGKPFVKIFKGLIAPPVKRVYKPREKVKKAKSEIIEQNKAIGKQIILENKKLYLVYGKRKEHFKKEIDLWTAYLSIK